MAKEKTTTPQTFPESPQDLVAVEVMFGAGVKENGRTYKRGETLNMYRGHAMAQNKPGRQVFRVLRTVKYANDPNPEAGYEGQADEGPIDVTPTEG